VDDFDPTIYGRPYEPDALEPSIWPTLTSKQQAAVLNTPAKDTLASDRETQLLIYLGRLYTRNLATNEVTVWDGRTYPTH